MLNEQKHTIFDFKKFNCKVYIIPHVNSSGPQIIPKIPITK